MTEIQPRNRTMPLVLEPFERVSLLRQGNFSSGPPLAKLLGRFCPNLNIPEYRETLSDEKKKSLDEQTERLNKRAIMNQFYESSEFGWEVFAWRDVFGALADDETFRLDKRPYEYVKNDEKGAPVVKRRIPDATLGLKTYDAYDLKHGYRCNVENCNVDHSSMQSDKRLSCDDLSKMMHDTRCGLVVDGVWGETNLVFPFAVYEAKKRASSMDAAENQVANACAVYLAMLDDLARDPNNVSQYQTSESSKLQLFAFTSSGPVWTVFIAWNEGNKCNVETIWSGDTKKWHYAFDLICIVDQIQDYAAHKHRPFVMKHLEAWHSRYRTATHNEYQRPSNIAFDALAAEVYRSLRGLPRWEQLKESTKNARKEKSMATRQRNINLRKLAQALDTLDNKPKRGRGRPPKKIGVAKTNDTKRGPGRPRKTSSTTTRIGKKKVLPSRH